MDIPTLNVKKMNKSKSKCAKPKGKSNNNKSSALFHLGAKLKILAIIW